MDRKDWTLLVIAAARSKSLTPAQLQKCLFLLGEDNKEAVSEDFYSFQKYDYGPFSSEIYGITEELESEELIQIQQSRLGWRTYSSTPDGIEKAEELRNEIDDEVAQFIDETVDWARRQSFQSLIKSIYSRFPEYRENSVFQD